MNFLKSVKLNRIIVFFILSIILLYSCAPGIVKAADDRTITFSQSYVGVFESSDSSISSERTYCATGLGNFVILTYADVNHFDDASGYAFNSYLVSNSSFTVKLSSYIINDTPINVSDDTYSATSYNNYFYYNLSGLWDQTNCYESFSMRGYLNIRRFDASVMSSLDALKKDLDDGSVDLSSDDYQDDEAKEKYAIYNSDLDLSSFGAHSYQAFTLSKDDDGWHFTTPSEAGIRYTWTYNHEIKNAYIKFTYYGDYYAKAFNPSYKDGVLSLGGEGISNVVSLSYSRSLKEKMIYNIGDVNVALKSKYGYSSVYSFVPKEIIAQCFATVDGEFCRSRAYRVNMDMVRDDKGDFWILEPTDSDPLPDDFVPDYDDPEPNSPAPDIVPDFDDTTPNPYPPNPTQPDYPDDGGLLSGLKWFYETLQGFKSSLGAFPALVSSVFSFLPPQVITLIGISIVGIILLRFLGR